MFLEQPIQDLRSTVITQAQGATGRVLTIQLRDEALRLAVKLVKSTEREIDGHFYPNAGTDESGQKFLEDWVTEISEQVEYWRPTFGDYPRYAPELPGLELPVLDRSIPQDVATVAWIEQTAERIFKLSPHLMLLAPLGGDLPDETRRAVLRFATLLRYRRASLLLLDAAATAVVPAQTLAARRISYLSLAGRDGDPRAATRTLLSGHAEPLAIVRAGGDELETWVREADPTWSVMHVRSPYRTTPALVKALAAEVTARTGVTIRDNPLVASDLMVDLEKARLAAKLDRWMIVIDPRPLPQTEHLADLLARLEDAPLCPRIKLVVLDEPDGRLTTELEHASLDLPARVLPIDLGVGAMEASAERAAAAGVTAKEKFQALVALSGFAAGRKETLQAVQHANGALRVAATAQERALAHLHVGQAWYREPKLEDAARAFAAGVDEIDSGDVPRGVVAALLWGLAGTALRAGESTEAANIFAQVADLYAESGQTLQQAAALGWRGEAQRLGGDPDGASITWDAALARVAHPDLGLEDQARAFRGEIFERKSRLMAERGDPAAARELHTHACACVPSPSIPPHP